VADGILSTLTSVSRQLRMPLPDQRLSPGQVAHLRILLPGPTGAGFWDQIIQRISL